MTIKNNDQTNLLNHRCPVCNTTQGNVLGLLEYSLLDSNPLASIFNVISCQKCGFVFCDTPSTQRDYDKFYEESFYSTSYISREIPEGENEYFEQIRNIVSKYLAQKDAVIFDIGCGVGRFLSTLRNSGYKQLYGVDPSPMCVDLLNESGGIQAACGSLADIPFTGVDADLIVLSHIVEHILDLKDALESIADRLSVNGLVYVEVPDARQYDEFEGVSPLRYFYFQHLIHFDGTHLVNLFEANGFEKVASGHHMRVEGELQMPCVWGIFKKCNREPPKVETDFQLDGQVRRWFSDKNLDQEGILGRLVASQSPVVIWGIGIHIQMMLAMSSLGQCNIKCFIDKDSRNQGETINGRAIESLEALSAVTVHDTVIIGAPTHSDEMYNYLVNKLGFNGRIIVCGFGDIRMKRS